jgi:hypothetical protein
MDSRRQRKVFIRSLRTYVTIVITQPYRGVGYICLK